VPRSMTLGELATLVESQTCEFKKSLSLTKEGLVSLDAMLNADVGRGLVLFGVAPDGTPGGIEPGSHDKAQRSLAQHIQSKFDPPLLATIEVVDCEGRPLLAVQATRSANVPAFPVPEGDRASNCLSCSKA